MDRRRSIHHHIISYLFPSSSSILCLCISFLVLLFTTNTNALVKLPENTTVPAIIVFGDSIVDAGNNDDLITEARCDYPPYGIDFDGGVPTGRFSNGKVPTDILAEELGIKPTIPAYRDPNLRQEDLLTGVTFASGGASHLLWKPLLLEMKRIRKPVLERKRMIMTTQQLKFFEEYIEKLNGMVGQERTTFIITNSLFVIICGSNDIANNFFSLPTTQLQYNVASFTALMADNARSFARTLYQYGARRILMFGAPPIGCVPSQRTVAGGPTRDCVVRFNDACKLFNAKLSANIDGSSRTLQDTTLIYIDIYDPLLDLILYPQQYGFKVSNLGCCGTGFIEVTALCNNYTAAVCPVRSDYVFWDSFHPTETAYRNIVAKLLQRYLNRFF
uniref:Uncharacterized protein n=1 Tax=Brassica oleracea TaxID=3712 RepID=A0A3P6FKU0_BRAOL|nr:unnamed protein product [Brassica oleracea]